LDAALDLLDVSCRQNKPNHPKRRRAAALQKIQNGVEPPHVHSFLTGGRSLLSGQLVRKVAGVIHLAQRLDDALRVDGDGSGDFVGEDEVQHQRLDVAVKDQTHHLRVLVDNGTAGVAADDVGGADEVQRRLQVELVPGLDPTGRQVERRLVV